MSLTDEFVKILNRFQQAQHITLNKINEPSFERNNRQQEIVDFEGEQATKKAQADPGDLDKSIQQQDGIFELEDDIKGLNTIFRDLAVLIHTQGERIETIDDHVR